MPLFAPLPFPTIIATGVASPSAHGQLITRTDIALEIEKPMLSPSSSHIINVIAATVITAGTKIPETLSAIFAIGAFEDDASLTSLIICASVVSSPTLSARHFKYPEIFDVADVTSLPTVLSTGMLSPVTAASLTALLPSITIPSTGIFSPGLTINISPFFTSLTGTSI